MLSRLQIKVVLIALAATFCAPVAWSGEWHYEDVARVVAIADIHGDYDAMLATLQQAGVVDETPVWTGGSDHLVVVGDILDRGPNSRAAMDFLMSLEGEATAAGGQVHVLIGNHESMLLTGDMRYVSAAEYAAFAVDEDMTERARWFALYVARNGGDASALRANFDKNFPLGYFAMRRAFRPDGQYGSWLLRKNIIDVINGTAFVHGGLSPIVSQIGLQGVNHDLQRELVEYVDALTVLMDAEILLPTDSHYDYATILQNVVAVPDEIPVVLAAIASAQRLIDSVLLDVDGPLWYRGNVICPGVIEEHRLNSALAAIGAERVVVGHTPTPNRQVLQRFGGQIIEIDTGMLGSYYHGSGNALVLEGEQISVINQSGAIAGVLAAHPRRVGRRPGNLSAAQLELLLQHGEIVENERLSPHESLLRVSDGTSSVSALFSKRRSKGFYPGVAAYRLDQLLQLDMVPVTTIRAVDSVPGSLQFLPKNRSDELARSSAAAGGGALCSLSDQWAAMAVFDVLIYNEARTHERMLYDPSTWQLILSGHRASFGYQKELPVRSRGVVLAASVGWQQALAALTDEVIAEKLGDVLSKRRLAALAARRDELLLPGADIASKK